MKVMDLGFGKGFGKFSNTLIFDIFITFHHAQATKQVFLACDRKPDFTQLCRTVHICEYVQWHIQDFPGGGIPTRQGGTNLFIDKFSETCMKMKKFDSGRWLVSLAPP